MTTNMTTNSYGIRDNRDHGKVSDFLFEKIAEGSNLSIVSAYFTIFAYTVLSHTDLSRDSGKVDGIDLATLNWGNFDLVVMTNRTISATTPLQLQSETACAWMASRPGMMKLYGPAFLKAWR